MKFISLYLIVFASTFAQTEFYKWDAKEVNYQFNYVDEKDYQSNSFFSHLQKIYTFFISEPDGDTCPFSPSCSNFFIEAVEKTNFLTGTLLFADRFTRDMNPFKSLSQYKKISYKKFFDPVEKYLFKN